MFKIIILACFAVSLSFSIPYVSRRLENPSNKTNNLIINLLPIPPKNETHLDIVKNDSKGDFNKTVKTDKIKSKVEQRHPHSKEGQISLPMLHKIHARITRSKDAVWATITLTFICVLLVLAVAHSRMWKDHYYKEAQGVPLPNFNERVLFKDVMEQRVASLKKFFSKKKSKEKDVTELESLLPPSEWD